MLRLLATRRVCRATAGRGLRGAPWAEIGRKHGFARGLASKPFNLADIGEGIAEVEVLQWFVKPDDAVEQVCVALLGALLACVAWRGRPLGSSLPFPLPRGRSERF